MQRGGEKLGKQPKCHASVWGGVEWKTMPYRLATFWLSHFHISCAGNKKKREKASKNTSAPLQTASSARISPSQAITSHRQEAHELCDGDIPQCSAQRLVQVGEGGGGVGAHHGVRWKDHTFRQVVVSCLRTLLCFPIRILIPPRLLQARL